MIVRTGLGQDSHRFEAGPTKKKLMLAGLPIPGALALDGNSDADVVLHALTHALGSLTGKRVLGAVSDAMCAQGIMDSREYVYESIKGLGSLKLTHVAVSLECARPRMEAYLDAMRASLAELLGLKVSDVGITATSGEGLTSFGRGEGIQAIVIVTAMELS